MEPDFTDLLARARLGEVDAIRSLIARYENIIRRAARGRLGPAMRPCLDSMDIVQSVHRSLLIGLRFQKFDISSPEQLIGLALTMVHRKVARQWLKLKRHPLPQQGDSELTPLNRVPGRESPPAEQASASEDLRQLLDSLDPVDRQLIELRLQGHSTAEVADLLHLDAAFLRVRLARLRKRLQQNGLIEDWL